MSERFELVLRGALVVDPENGVESVCDIGVREGRVAAVSPEISGSGDVELDLAGFAVVPGIIDLHVHVSPWLGGRVGHRMLALAGVTTALDMAGPIEGVVSLARDYGAGLNIACVNYVRPGHTVATTDPDEDELRDLLHKSLRAGAIGLKLLGGHFPMTPDAAARTIAVAADEGAYVAFHAGTLATGSHIDGMLEACELAAGHPLHMAHINSYTRGLVRAAMTEGEEALAALQAHPNLTSESYLSPINATSAKCSDGAPESLQTRNWLKIGGFAPTEAGLAEAIEAGWALLNEETQDTVVLATGRAAVDAWRARKTELGVSVMANPSEPRLRLATAKGEDGRFIVDTLATDGGGIPRNVIVEMGLALVRLEAWTMADFVQKSSTAPARALGLSAKGHLGIGADADISVLDVERGRPKMSFVAGSQIMRDGVVTGSGTRLITTPLGEAAAREAGIAGPVVPLGSMLRRG
ncbi:MAG TPA: amidohydrolase family protein [Saliniramus sp.]|nr:amidohydrolase family protein [Saliniramus sp.]